MKAGGYLTDGTELHDTNFARLPKPAALRVSAWKKRLKSMSPATRLLHRRSGVGGCGGRQEELAIPPQIKLEQAKGFSL